MTDIQIELTGSAEFIPLLPLKNVVILPKSIMPIIVGRQISIEAVEYALKHDKSIFITAQKDSQVETPTAQDVFTHGTRSVILQVIRMPNGSLKILAEGMSRAVIKSVTEQKDFIGVTIEDIPTQNIDQNVELEAIWRQLDELYTTYTKINDKAPTDLTAMVKNPQDMDYISDTIAVHIEKLSIIDRQKILECADLPQRMLELCSLLKKEISILQTEQKIRGRVQNQVEKSQREYYLTEQMKAIQKELGRDDLSIEIEQLEEQAHSAGLSKEAQEKVTKELRRLEQMPPLSSEAVVSRNYIDWILSLPWKKTTKDTLKISQAEQILDKSHAGLTKAKERIIEFLAAKKFATTLSKSPVICLVGPPGVGKTSLARSIAESLGREFVRISLGGVRDEAEIRGHRRTYIGSLPGKIIQAMKKAKAVNPVILLDEIDKMSRDSHGDPSAALLEVLDPEQNKGFVDNYLEVEYDLSQVMFIATANMIDQVPYALFDRLEIINLSGYTDEEKLSIAKQFLIPSNLKEYNLTKKNISMSDELVMHIITDYTKEAGVRQLDRIIAKLMRKTIQILLKTDQKNNKKIVLSKELILEWLGHPKVRKTSLNQKEHRVGLAVGLAWTELGGDVLEIETSAIPGKGNLTLTGQLGEVMQESAQAALSYIRSRTKELGLKSSFYTSKDVHLHIPEGATPKDGPSAGIAICTALVSAFTEKPTKTSLAMTGEITLQGRVLAVGGLKEKLLAAKQYHINTVIVPKENYDDIEEVKREINLEKMRIVYVSIMDEVIDEAFAENPFTSAVKKSTKGSAKKKKAVAKPAAPVKSKKTSVKKKS